MIPEVLAETERLRVRRMSPDDVDEFLAYQTHPKVMRYQPYEPATRESAIRFLTKEATQEASEDGYYIAFAVCHNRDQKVMGEVCLDVAPKAQSKAVIGWAFHPDYHGQGYAREAAQALLCYAFTDLALHRIHTFCDTRNTASFRLMERLGMRREGHTKQSMYLRGEWADEFHYALLQSEWRNQQA